MPPFNRSGADHRCAGRLTHSRQADGGREVGPESVRNGEGGGWSHACEGLKEAAIVNVTAELARGDGQDAAGELFLDDRGDGRGFGGFEGGVRGEGVEVCWGREGGAGVEKMLGSE